MKFAAAISRGLNIYENSRVIEMRGLTAVTREAKVRSRNVIVATHFPFINKHGFYFLKMYQHRSYVLVLKNAQSVDGMYIDASEKGLSFRNYKDILLLGGGSHRTGKRGGGSMTENIDRAGGSGTAELAAKAIEAYCGRVEA